MSLIKPDALLLILLASCPVMARADTIDAGARRLEKRLEVVLRWPSPVEMKSTVAGRELLLEFSRPCEGVDPDSLIGTARDWLEAVSTGYDSLLLRAARDVTFDVVVHEGVVTVTLDPAEPECASGSRLRLELLEARLLNETGRTRDAVMLLERLAVENPDNPFVLASLAGLKHQIGQSRAAGQYYSRALSFAPQNQELIQEQRRLREEHALHFAIDLGLKSVSHAQDEQLAQIAGRGSLAEWFRFGFVADQSRFDTENIRRACGDMGEFSGLRHRAEFFAQQLAINGSRVTQSLYLADDLVGTAFAFARPDWSGSTRFSIEYQRPYWEYVEGLVDGGSRDRVEIQRNQRLARNLSTWALVSLNRYGVWGDPGVASSVGVSGAVVYLLRRDGSVALQYGFDGEFRTAIDSRTDQSGQVFHPIPLVSREVHAPGISLFRQLGRSLHADCFAGFAVDRRSGSGPFIEARLAGELGRGFEGGIAFERRLNSVNTGEVVHRLSARLTWKGK